MRNLLVTVTVIMALHLPVSADDFNYSVQPDSTSVSTDPVGKVASSTSVSATGGAVVTIPIEVPQGIGGMQPSVSLVYNSQSGNGLAGYGTNIAGLSSITRAGKDRFHDGVTGGLSFSDSDVLLLDGKRLLIVTGNYWADGSTYSPEGDPLTVVTLHGGNQPTWLEVTDAQGMTMKYGDTEATRLSLSGTTVTWYLRYVFDAQGDKTVYSYTPGNNSLYPSTITYGGNLYASNGGLSNTVEFLYEDRPDVEKSWILGHEVQVGKRLSTVLTKTNGTLFRRYELSYDDTGDQSSRKYSRLTSVTEKNGQGEALRPLTLEWENNPSYEQEVTDSVTSLYTPSSNETIEDYCFLSFDYNGDGYGDLLQISNHSFNVGNEISRCKACHLYTSQPTPNNHVSFSSPYNFAIAEQGDFNIDSFVSRSVPYPGYDFDGDGICDLICCLYQTGSDEFFFRIFSSKRSNPITLDFYINTNEGFLTTYNDFDNDGVTDVLVMEKRMNAGQYLFSLKGHKADNTLPFFTTTLPDSPKELFSGDFNSDGLNDIIVFYEGGYKILWNQGVGDNESLASAFRCTSTTFNTNIGYVSRIWQGDFNGDGKPDFLMNNEDDHNWYFALGNGSGTFNKVLAACLEVYEQNGIMDDDKLTCIVYDFDNDGMTDVVITKAKYILGISFQETATCWLRSTGTALQLVKTATSTKAEDALNGRMFLGDVDGDGHLELLNYGYDCYNSTNANVDPSIHVYKTDDLNLQTGKVTTLDDGINTTQVSYGTMTNPYLYTPVVPDSVEQATGIACLTLPLNAVSSIESAGRTASYHYDGLRFHLRGRGLLGLTRTTVLEPSTGHYTENGISQWNTQYVVPSKSYTRTVIGSYVSLTEDSLKFTAKPCNNYMTTPFRTLKTDSEDNVTTTTYTYDTDHGTLLTQTTAYGDTDTRKSVACSGYVLKGGQWKPQTVTLTQRHDDDSDEYETVTRYTYDDKGRVTQKKEFADTDMELTTTYTYNTLGNQTATVQSGYEVAALTHIREYDATGRFVTREYTSASPTPDMRYTYDLWGNVLTESDCTAGTGSMALTTTHTYDNWGRLRETLDPYGVRSRTTWGWDTPRTWFKLEQATHTPWKKTTYDSRGRESVIQSIDAKDITLRTVLSYDSHDNKTAQTDIRGTSTVYTHYSYDARDRLTEENCYTLNKVTTYTYGNRSITSTTDGKSYTKTYDEAGLLRTSSDSVSSVSYTYNSLWKPASVTSENATVTMDYDEAGNQTQLTDPDAGTTTYGYDALGRVITQTDARGVITETSYDALGNVTETTCGDITTSYTYGQSGRETLKPVFISTGTDSITFTYCKYGLRSKRQYIDGLDELYYHYTYTSDGQLRSSVYPTGMQLFYEYDSYGNNIRKKTLQLTQGMTFGNDGSTIPATAATVWQLDSVTGTASVASVLSGTLRARETVNAVGLLTGKQLYAGSTRKSWQSYTYDNKTGNLLSRNVMLSTETFTYDNLDRLVTYNNESVEYADNGNITSKSGIGDYTYSLLSRPHAVISVENEDELLSASTQSITYNAFGKADTLRMSNGTKQLSLIYGPDQQRWKSEYYVNKHLRCVILYGDNYEQVTQNDTTRHYLYLGDGVLCVQDANLLPRYYYMETDHQGSVVQIWNTNASEVFMAVYDAWGKCRVFQNDIAFQRGYTGHEMLPEFGLINMNGRMYDPLLGRFLSPDNYVQMPDFSQNFNRYSYCLNNPLKYVDKNGELLEFVTGFFKGLYRAITGKGKWTDPFTYAYKNTVNEIKIAFGLVAKGTPKQILSRFTWELPQTIFGWYYSMGNLYLGNVDHVRYFDGATYLIDDVKHFSQGITIGNFINITSYNIPIDSKGNFAPYNDPLYMHEYGHYLQSQEYGWGYLVSVGVPSLMSAINSKSLDDPPFSTHNFFWAEISANKKAKNYFENRYDISWNDLVSHRYNKWYHIYELYPLSSPY